MFIKLLILVFDGHVKTDNGSLGKSSIQFNEDDGDEMMADVIWSAMINEGDDCDDIDHEKKELEFMGWGLKHRWTLRV